MNSQRHPPGIQRRSGSTGARARLFGCRSFRASRRVGSQPVRVIEAVKPDGSERSIRVNGVEAPCSVPTKLNELQRKAKAAGILDGIPAALFFYKIIKYQ